MPGREPTPSSPRRFHGEAVTAVTGAGHDGGMRGLVQRVSRASVTVDGEVIGSIGGGLCVLVGVTHADDRAKAAALAAKVWHLRVFEGSDGRMDLPVADVGGEVLLLGGEHRVGHLREGDALLGGCEEISARVRCQPVDRALWEPFVRAVCANGRVSRRPTIDASWGLGTGSWELGME